MVGAGYCMHQICVRIFIDRVVCKQASGDDGKNNGHGEREARLKNSESEAIGVGRGLC